jgi:hypothetical protein
MGTVVGIIVIVAVFVGLNFLIRYVTKHSEPKHKIK